MNYKFEDLQRDYDRCQRGIITLSEWDQLVQEKYGDIACDSLSRDCMMVGPHLVIGECVRIHFARRRQLVDAICAGLNPEATADHILANFHVQAVVR